MECGSCGNDHWITRDSRKLKTSVKRRKECKNCGIRITTFEYPHKEKATVTEHQLFLIQTIKGLVEKL